MCEPLGCSGYEIHVIRGDGTNSSAAQRTKVHTCVCTSTYSANASADQFEQVNVDSMLIGPLDFEDRTRNCYADCRYLPLSCTSRALLEVYKAQLGSIGVLPFQRQEHQLANVVRIVCLITDNGPDERGCAQLITEELKEDKTTLFLRLPCFLHQLHLICSRQLKRLDGDLALKALP